MANFTGDRSLSLFVALAPLILVIALMASRRVPGVATGLAGWATALGSAALLGAGADGFARYAIMESLKGAWIAFQAVPVILAGLLFYRTVEERRPATAGSAVPGTFSHRRLWIICFLLGPFAESATGFGVGCIVALAALQGIGLNGPRAAFLALYSQILVPWGALAVGTLIGAQISGLPDQRLGYLTALLTIPLLLGHLPFFWAAVRRLGHPVPFARKLDDVLWTLALSAALAVASHSVATELGTVTAAGLLLILRWWRDERPDGRALRLAMAQAAPFLTLAGLLVATRVIAPVTRLLKHMAVIAPFDGLPAFPAFYNPTFWLLLVSCVVLASAGRLQRLPALMGRTWIAGWRAVAVTVTFIAMAQILSSAGAARLVGESLHHALGAGAPLTGPLFGAVGGFLTGSNAASNGMMMAVQAALGNGIGDWTAAIQNTTGSAFTMLSPVRVAMAASMIGASEGEIYRLAWPTGLMILLVMTAEAALVILHSAP